MMTSLKLYSKRSSEGHVRTGRQPIVLQAARGRQPAGGDVPPPPTVAPPTAPVKAPKTKQAFRQRRKTAEERAEEQATAEAELKAATAGRTQYLTTADLQHRSAVASARAFAGTHTTTAAGQRKPDTWVLIDGYNLIHHHNSTKQMIHALGMDQARSHLHVLLKQHAEQAGIDVTVVYDNVKSGAAVSAATSDISERVDAYFTPGLEADTVIIDWVSNIHKQHSKAVAAGRPAADFVGYKEVLVITNDTRIHDACTGPGAVYCMLNKQLSDTLQQLENKLSKYNAGAQLASPQETAAAVQAVTAVQLTGWKLPDPNTNTHAWASQILARSKYDIASVTCNSRLSPKHRRQQQKQHQHRPQQQQHQQPEQVHYPDVSCMSDEELLRHVRAATPAAALDSTTPHTAAAAAESGSIGSGSSSSSHASDLLDDVLALDIDGLLSDQEFMDI